VVERRGDLHRERWGRSTMSAARQKGKKRWRKSGLASVGTCGENRGDEELLRGQNWRREGGRWLLQRQVEVGLEEGAAPWSEWRVEDGLKINSKDGGNSEL
jgi:hypothetical protein